MITYNSGLQNAPPITEALLSSAKTDMLRKSPYAYPGSHQDILSARGQGNMAQLRHSAEKANTDYGLQQQRAQNDLSLAGLQQMASAQQQQRQLATSRAGAAMNAYSGLLSGLFG